MKLGVAMEVLGLVGTSIDELTDADVKRAFNATAIRWHPDSELSKMQQGKPPLTMDQIKEARDTLLNRRNVDDFTCKTCKGSGTVRYRMGTRACMPCKGTGDSRGS